MSTWGDIAQVVGKAAPIIGTVLGGPLGAAAGGLVASALGVSNDADSVSAAIAADPQALEKIKEAELNAKVQLQQLVVQAESNLLQAETSREQTAAADRASARNREVSTKDTTPRNLAYLYTTALFAVIGAEIYYGAHVQEINAVAARTLDTLLGVLIAMVLGTKEYYFGSSARQDESQKKVLDFAVSPGAVTTETGAPLKPPAEARDDLAKNWTK